jgi:hypothetical protein
MRNTPRLIDDFFPTSVLFIGAAVGFVLLAACGAQPEDDGPTAFHSQTGGAGDSLNFRTDGPVTVIEVPRSIARAASAAPRSDRHPAPPPSALRSACIWLLSSASG